MKGKKAMSNIDRPLWLATVRRARSLHAVAPNGNHSLCHPYLQREFIERDGLPHCPKCEALFRHRDAAGSISKSLTAFAIYEGKRPLSRDEKVPVYWIKAVAETEARELRDAGHLRAEVLPVLISPLSPPKKYLAKP
jgi:hypothetical protein